MTALCTVSYCPAKSDPDWHYCFVCQNNTIEHHHVRSRGMGGSKEKSPVVALCHPHHEMVTLHECSDDILEIKGVSTYVYFDLHGKALAERPLSQEEEPVLSAAAEDSAGEYVLTAQAQGNAPGEKRQRDKKPRPSSAAAPRTGPKEESDADSCGDASVVSPDSNVERLATPGNTPNAGGVSVGARLSHEQRVAIAKEIKDTEWNRQWIAGDTANAWRAELGEEAEQYLSDFGYVELSLANIMRVCENIPPAFRHGNLRFSHHVVVAGLPREDIEMWLHQCELEEWSVAEFRRQVKGTKPKVKRYSLEELRELFGIWLRESSSPAMPHVAEFLDWLGEQG